MGFDDPFRDRQAETRTQAAGSGGCLPEAIEDALEIFGRHPSPRIDDPEERARFAAGHAHPHLATRGSELERVSDEVLEDLQQAVAVTENRGSVGRRLD